MWRSTTFIKCGKASYIWQDQKNKCHEPISKHETQRSAIIATVACCVQCILYIVCHMCLHSANLCWSVWPESLSFMVWAVVKMTVFNLIKPKFWSMCKPWFWVLKWPGTHRPRCAVYTVFRTLNRCNWHPLDHYGRKRKGKMRKKRSREDIFMIIVCYLCFILFSDLERQMAKMFGKEAALFVPSGTMGNLIGGK